jgi:hypothetical protein
MPRTMSVSDSVVIAAAPSAVCAQLSDPTAKGRRSPENRGATVHGKRREAYVVFEGRNKRGAMRFTTRCTVTAADPGAPERFSVPGRAFRRNSWVSLPVGQVVRGPLSVGRRTLAGVRDG